MYIDCCGKVEIALALGSGKQSFHSGSVTYYVTLNILTNLWMPISLAIIF